MAHVELSVRVRPLPMAEAGNRDYRIARARVRRHRNGFVVDTFVYFGFEVKVHLCLMVHGNQRRHRKRLDGRGAIESSGCEAGLGTSVCLRDAEPACSSAGHRNDKMSNMAINDCGPGYVAGLNFDDGALHSRIRHDG